MSLVNSNFSTVIVLLNSIVHSLPEYQYDSMFLICQLNELGPFGERMAHMIGVLTDSIDPDRYSKPEYSSFVSYVVNNPELYLELRKHIKIPDESEILPLAYQYAVNSVSSYKSDLLRTWKRLSDLHAAFPKYGELPNLPFSVEITDPDLPSAITLLFPLRRYRYLPKIEDDKQEIEKYKQNAIKEVLKAANLYESIYLASKDISSLDKHNMLVPMQRIMTFYPHNWAQLVAEYQWSFVDEVVREMWTLSLNDYHERFAKWQKLIIRYNHFMTLFPLDGPIYT